MIIIFSHFFFLLKVASALLAIPNVVAIIGCPYFGWFVDQHGRALMFIIVASFMLVVTHLGFLGNALGLIFMIVFIVVIIFVFIAFY